MENLNFIDYEPTPQITGSEAAARAQAGDNDAYGEWWKSEGAQIATNAARRAGADHHTAEDMTQETAIAVWLAMRKGKANFSDSSEVRGYAAASARNRTISEYRRARTQREVLVDEHYDSQNHAVRSAEAVAIADMTRQKSVDTLEQAFGKILPAQAEAVAVDYMSPESLTDYAARTGQKLATMRTKAFRGKAKLRKDEALHAALRDLVDLSD